MLRTLTLLSAAILATHVSHTAMAQEVSSNDVVQPPASANVESADQSNHFQTAFLRRHKPNYVGGRAISSIAGHYPQEIVSIVDIALDTYPDKYREIIFAAILHNLRLLKRLYKGY